MRLSLCGLSALPALPGGSRILQIVRDRSPDNGFGLKAGAERGGGEGGHHRARQSQAYDRFSRSHSG
jgi:hypothetical protein